MPKIIDNVRERLLEVAKKQLMEIGYSAMTIRSVAKECKVGVGTVYNYFASKDMLVASFMLEDWQECLDKIVETSNQSEDIKDVLFVIYEQLKIFAQKYDSLFHDENAEQSQSRSSGFRHKMLRKQIAKPLKKFCKGENPEFMAEFLAENMLTWTYSNYEFEEITKILLKVL